MLLTGFKREIVVPLLKSCRFPLPINSFPRYVPFVLMSKNIKMGFGG
jgi:hypothetical protein